MRKILVHDLDKDDIKDFFSEYKNLEICNIKNLKIDKTETVYYDCTSNSILYKKFMEKYELKEFTYLFDTTFVKNDFIKVIKLNDLRNFLFYKNKERFDLEKQTELKEGHDLILNVLNKTLDKFQNVLEKELNEIPDILNISEIENSKDCNYWFVKDKTKSLVPDGKVIDYKTLLLLMELKDILKYKVS